MDLIIVGTGIVFIILGIVFLSGRGSSLIAGYNTMPKEKKGKYDAKALCKFTGVICMLIGILVFGLAIESIASWYTWFSTIAVIAILVFAVIYANTGNRFKK